MVYIKYFLFFLLGIIFIQWIFPVLDSLSTLICTDIEAWKGKASLKIAELNNNIANIGKEKTMTAKPIGFAIEVEEEDEELNDNIL